MKSRDPGDWFLNLILVAAVAVGLAWVAAQATAWFTEVDQPTSGLVEGALNLLTQPGDPGAAWGTTFDTGAYWAAVALFVVVTMALVWLLWRVFRSPDPRRLVKKPATRVSMQATSTKALLKRAARLRPSLADEKKIRPEQVGYLVGTVRKKPVWLSIQEAVVILGPPRSGKRGNFVVPMIVEAPGAVVATAVTTDSMAMTIRQRERVGPVAVFAPSLGQDLPSVMRWSPIRGCEDPDTALRRAHALTAGSAREGATPAPVRERASQALYPMLHAAALSGVTTAEFDRWCSGPTAAAEAVTVLREYTRSVPGWADKLEEIIMSGDPKARDDMWTGVREATKALSNPNVLEACSPRSNERFDPVAFLAESGTLYVIGDDRGTDGPLIAALVEDIAEAAKHAVATAPENQLDPPLLVMLEDISTITYLPSLPVLTSTGHGITTVNSWSSRAQIRDRWGPEIEQSVWETSTVKLVLGGVSDPRDLHDLSALAGSRYEPTYDSTWGADGTRTTSQSWRELPIIPPEQIATLPRGVALMVHPGQPPVLIDLISYLDRRYAGELTSDHESLTAELRGGPPPAAVVRSSTVQ